MPVSFSLLAHEEDGAAVEPPVAIAIVTGTSAKNSDFRK
jgi:hypothetical protein